MAQNHVALSLFWRTFFLLAILLAGGVFAWTQTFRAMEFEPRAVQAAQQIASLVNLSRAALRSTDGINRVALIKSMQNQESMRLQPREPSARTAARGWARTRWWRARSTARPACAWASPSTRTRTGCRPTRRACS